MAEVIVMPKLGLSMEKGVVAAWHKKEGDSVASGDALFDVESDKLSNSVESDVEGVLLKIVQGEGNEVACFEPVAIIGEPGEDISGLL